MRFFHSVHSKDENIAAFRIVIIRDLFLDRLYLSPKSGLADFRLALFGGEIWLEQSQWS